MIGPDKWLLFYSPLRMCKASFWVSRLFFPVLIFQVLFFKKNIIIFYYCIHCLCKLHKLGQSNWPWMAFHHGPVKWAQLVEWLISQWFSQHCFSYDSSPTCSSGDSEDYHGRGKPLELEPLIVARFLSALKRTFGATLIYDIFIPEFLWGEVVYMCLTPPFYPSELHVPARILTQFYSPVFCMLTLKISCCCFFFLFLV